MNSRKRDKFWDQQKSGILMLQVLERGIDMEKQELKK